jgi:hypothetical protein
MNSILKKIIGLFIGKKEEIFKKISSQSQLDSSKPNISQKSQKKTTFQYSQTKKRNQHRNTTTSIQKNTNHPPRINIPRLEMRIKKNILFLYELSLALQAEKKYAAYLTKVLDMKDQSEACLKMLFKLDKNAPYFYNTVRLILNHAEIVSELRKET